MRQRDPRLDFFRGLAMFFILLSHTPGNGWARWTPAQFGFSDATEIFVFCSGMASALAFGTLYDRAGWLPGTARVGLRIWQIYWAHVGLFLVIAAALAAIDLSGAFEKIYVDTLALGWFFSDPRPMLVGLMTLTYVPNYFDILPMYLAILVMFPVAMALLRVHRFALFAASLALWVVANLGLLALPAEPLADREWFFNPFGWQLVFYLGFAFMAGLLPAPPVSRALVWLAVAFLVLTLPLSSGHAVGWLEVVWPAAAEWASAVYPDMFWMRTKTELGFLRVLHFVALAYLAWIAVGPGGARLMPDGAGEGAGPGARVWAGLVRTVCKVGQQTLPVFLVSMVLARAMGFAFDLLGEAAAVTAGVNLAGFAILVATAHGVGWIKSQPWKARAA